MPHLRTRRLARKALSSTPREDDDPPQRSEKPPGAWSFINKKRFTSGEAEIFDLWMRGDPLRLWAESMGHSNTANFPTPGDIWSWVTGRSSPDMAVIGHLATYLRIYGYGFEQNGRAGLTILEPHLDLGEFSEGARATAASLTNALDVLGGERSGATVKEGGEGGAGESPEGGGAAEEERREAVKEARALLEGALGPQLRRRCGSLLAAASEGWPKGLEAAEVASSVLACRVTVRARDTISQVAQLEPVKSEGAWWFLGPLMKESHRVVLLPLETGAAEGGALVCFREVGGLYAAIYEVSGEFLAQVASEAQAAGRESTLASGASSPVQLAAEHAKLFKIENEYGTEGFEVGGVSGLLLKHFLEQSELCFPAPLERQDQAQAQLLVDVAFEAPVLGRLHPSRQARQAKEKPASTSKADTDSAAASDSKPSDDTSGGEVSLSELLSRYKGGIDDPKQRIGDEDWARVQAEVDRASAEVRGGEEAQTPPSGGKAAEVRAEAKEEAEGPGAGVWRSVWTLSKELDLRPRCLWDHDWVVADIDGIVLGVEEPGATKGSKPHVFFTARAPPLLGTLGEPLLLLGAAAKATKGDLSRASRPLDDHPGLFAPLKGRDLEFLEEVDSGAKGQVEEGPGADHQTAK